MLSKNIETMAQTPWLEYATYDEDGFVNGVRENAPADIKKAYQHYQKTMQECIAKNEPIMR